MIGKERLREVLEECEAGDPPEGAYWEMVYDVLGVGPTVVMDMIARDPRFYGFAATEPGA